MQHHTRPLQRCGSSMRQQGNMNLSRGLYSSDMEQPHGEAHASASGAIPQRPSGELACAKPSRWHYWLWDDEENRAFLACHYVYEWFSPHYDEYDHFIKRVDAVRIFYLYHHDS